MFNLRRPATGLLRAIALSAANPVILVSVLGPYIVLNVFTRLYNFDKVRLALEQPIVHSLLELQSQAYVHILALTILLIAYAGSLFQACIRSHESFIFVKDQFTSPLHLIILLVVLFALFFGLFIWLGTPSSNLLLLETYTCPLQTSDGRCSNITAPVGLPPQNIVTYGRFALTYAALLTIHIPITSRESKSTWKTFIGISVLATVVTLFFTAFR